MASVYLISLLPVWINGSHSALKPLFDDALTNKLCNDFS